MQTPQTPSAHKGPVLAPNGLYVEGDDYLLISSLNAVSNVRITIGGRMITPAGRPQPFRDSHVATADRVAATSTLRLGEGYLVELTAIVEGASPRLGQTFVRVDLVRGDGPGRNVHATLIQGPITAFLRAAWPGTPVQTTVGLPGAIRSVTGTDPAAGAEILETVPTGARWRLITFAAVLTTDATVATREGQLLIDDGSTVVFRSPASNNHVASSAITYSAAASSAAMGTSAGVRGVGLHPEILLPAGFRIRTNTINLQAGDNWAAPQLLVEEWLEGA